MEYFISGTAQKVKFSIKNFFSKCDKIHRKSRAWLLKKFLMENFIFCGVSIVYRYYRNISKISKFTLNIFIYSWNYREVSFWNIPYFVKSMHINRLLTTSFRGLLHQNFILAFFNTYVYFIATPSKFDSIILPSWEKISLVLKTT